MNLLALAGGVGGAKLADGLAKAAGAQQLTVIVNTADDFVLHGLHISPDVDTVMYALAGVANPETGWGVQGDTWENFGMLERYGNQPWFRLGDRDLATHLLRTEMLNEGATLSEVTRDLAQRLKVESTIMPMSDDSVRTLVDTDQGPLPFQEYFVKHGWQPVVRALLYEGATEADPAKRATIYQQFNKAYYDTIPTLLLANPLGHHYEQRWVQGWYSNPLFGNMYYYALSKQ